MRRPRSIARKLTGMNMLVAASALLLAFAGFLAYDQATYRDNVVRTLSAQAEIVGSNSISALVFSDPEAAQKTLDALHGSPNVMAAAIFTDEGALFAQYERTPGGQIVPPRLRPAEVQAHRFGEGEVVLARRIVLDERSLGVVYIRADLREIYQRLWQFLLIAGAVLGLSLLAALAISGVFQRGIAQPVIGLAETAKRVSREQNYSIRAASSGGAEELDVLTAAFNDMLSQIQDRDAVLETERARLQAIIDSVPVGIVLADAASGRTILANRRVSEILGRPFFSARSADPQWEAYHPDGRRVESADTPLMHAIRTGETVRSVEHMVRRDDGSLAWVRSSAAPIHDREGRIVAGVVAVSSIEEQKRAEQKQQQAQEALLQSEKLAAVGRLAASISHEINNPLESVTNLLYLIAREPALPPSAQAYVAQAEQELARVSHIATQTLRFYRQATKPVSADLGNMMDSILVLLRGRLANAEVDIQRRYRAASPLVCLEGEMRQVFTNLISNALDAMSGRKGRLMLRTSSIGWHPGGPALRVTVADTGAGIPPDVSPRVFEPFFSTKGTHGTGLGLWVAKEIVHRHGGHILVRSQAGRGTVFSLILPLAGSAQISSLPLPGQAMSTRSA